MVSSFTWSIFFKKGEGIGNLATNIRRTFRAYLVTFLTVRIIWLSIHSFHGDGVATFILNRVAVITLLTGFTLILFYWAERFHKNYYDTKGFLPLLGGVFVFVNTALYAFQIVIIVLWVFSNEVKEGNPLYEANIVTDVALSAAISLGFFIYGWLLFFLTKNSDDGDKTHRTRELIKILIITVVFTACFLGRCFMFLYRPITDKKFSDQVFYTFAYFVPEVIPCLLQIYLAETSRGQQERENKFIDDLYAESQDSIEEYRESIIEHSETAGLIEDK